jgi:hypothetical protein
MFGEWHLYATLLVSYIGLIFAFIYLFEGVKSERILTALAFTSIGGLLTLVEVYGRNTGSLTEYPTLMAIA